MILSNAALNWASIRSGMSLHEFLSSLTPGRRRYWLLVMTGEGLRVCRRISQSYLPCRPRHHLQSPKKAKIERLIEQIAGEVEKEQEEEAEFLEETMEAIDSTPVELVPKIVEEIATEDEEEPSEPSVDIDEPADTSAAEEEPPEEAAPAPPSVDIDEEEMAAAEEAAAEEQAEAPEDAAEEAPKEVTAPSISGRFAAIARKLPREGDPDLYSQILEQLGGSVEALRMAAQITWEEYRRRHKGTAAISAFLNWLNGQSNDE